jgi:enterobactin synthetase component D
LSKSISCLHRQGLTIGRSELAITHDLSFVSDMNNSGVSLPAALQSALLLRQCEFLAGRWCAMQALKKIGIERPTQPGIDKHKVPIWPKNVLGSISHTVNSSTTYTSSKLGSLPPHGTAVAVVTLTNQHITGIGIDQESIFQGPIAHQMAQKILLPEEFIFSEYFSSFNAFVTTIFSSKEALYKAMFSQIKRIVGFHVAQVTHVDIAEQCLVLTLNTTLSEQLIKGRNINVYFSQSGGVIETFTAV